MGLVPGWAIVVVLSIIKGALRRTRLILKDLANNLSIFVGERQRIESKRHSLSFILKGYSNLVPDSTSCVGFNCREDVIFVHAPFFRMKYTPAWAE